MIAAALLGAALAIPRDEVLDNAARYATHVWRSSAANQYATCTDGDYESDYPPGDYVGLPYDWGGYVTLDAFDAQIADGYGAGSHSWHGILSCTTGVDCSGFVSMIWETDHYSTSTFGDGPTHPIDWDELDRGDAVNDPGSHIVLFAHTSDAGWPFYYEAAGGAAKVRLNTTGGWSYLDGYEPIRYDGIEAGPVSGTSARPRDITSFPYSDFRWTAGAASDAIDRYGCAPDTDESGPEVMYRFEAATAGTLEVVVSDDVGVDIDVHVLTAPDGDACLARHDSAVAVEVEPGTVWIVADTWAGDDEYPGVYVLSADFDGELGELEPLEPTDTGEPVVSDDSGAPDGGAEGEADGLGDVRAPPRAVRASAAPEPDGCGCASGGDGGGLALLGALAALAARRVGSREGPRVRASS